MTIERQRPPVFPNVMIVTVNFNLEHDTVACIHSLVKSGAGLEQVVVVDNASTNDPKELLRETFGGKLVVLTSTENLGYAHGLNLGIDYALGKPETEWFLLINNDTEVREDFLHELARAAAPQQYALLGPAIFYMDDPHRIWGFGDTLVPELLSPAVYITTRRCQIPCERRSMWIS
jgi:GT2 family glycosyltransferase